MCFGNYGLIYAAALNKKRSKELFQGKNFSIFVIPVDAGISFINNQLGDAWLLKKD